MPSLFTDGESVNHPLLSCASASGLVGNSLLVSGLLEDIAISSWRFSYDFCKVLCLLSFVAANLLTFEGRH